MKVLILAAGEGRRIAQLSDTIPKPLIPLNSVEVSCLSHTLNQLLLHGITEIYVSVGYKYDVFTSFFTHDFIPNHPQAVIKTVDARPQYIYGPIHSFIAAESLLVREQCFLVLPGDTIFNEHIFHQLSRFISSTTIHFPLTCSFQNSSFVPSNRKFNNYLTFEKADRVEIQVVKSIETLESASKKKLPMDVLIPIMILPGSFFSYARKRREQGDLTLFQAVQSYFAAGHPLYNLSINCDAIPFYDMDTLSDYEEIKKYLNV